MRLNIEILREAARIIPIAAASAVLVWAPQAHAVGTVAGTTISNTATATYNDPGSGNPITVPSNRVDIKVAQVVNITVASTNPGDVAAQPGATNAVLSYKVTNTGNGNDTTRLAPINAIGGDNFDPTTTQIVIDNGNGVYEPGIDTVYLAGTNDPALAPDASVNIFLISTIPAAATDGQRGQTDLKASSNIGTGPAGTVVTGAGNGGVDAVVGATTGVGQDKGFYVVQSATVAVVKSATIVDPLGGSQPIPGAIITYKLVAAVTGSGSLGNLVVSDLIPGATTTTPSTTNTYVPGSITLDGNPLTDVTDGDVGEFSSNTVAVKLGTVTGAAAPGTQHIVTFKTKIN